MAVDLQGHGRSGANGKITRFSDYARDIVRLVNDLDLREIIPVCWSMGAQIILKAYPVLKDRIAGLVLVGATPRFSSAPHFPHGLHPKEAEGMRLKVKRNLGRALEGFNRNLFTDSELSDDVHARQVEEIMASVVPPSTCIALDGLEALMEEEVLEEARKVRCPTLLLHGEKDTICLPAASAWLHQVIPDSHRIVYNGCGHAPFLSHPKRFNRDLQVFTGGIFGKG